MGISSRCLALVLVVVWARAVRRGGDVPMSRLTQDEDTRSRMAREHELLEHSIS